MSMLQSFTRLKKGHSHRLRAKFTLAYTWTAMLTVLVIEVILIGVAALVLSANVPDMVLSDVKQKAAQVGPFFSSGIPDREVLSNWLQVIKTNSFTPDPIRSNLIFLSLVDQEGKVLSSATIASPEPINQPAASSSSLQEAGLQAVLADPKGATSWSGLDPDGSLIAIAPVVDKAGEIRGALISKFRSPLLLEIIPRFLILILGSMAIVTAIAAVAGLIFGYRTAGGLTRRLEGLSVAAERWSKGDFLALVKDPSQDELGQLSRQLNQMAEQLHNLLTAREKLATLEERNRMARDLHDSVKQQIFAVGMQLGATKYLIKSDPGAAEARLNQAQQLVSQAQEELTSLILELRPVALEGKGLVAALQEFSTGWTNQTGIESDLRVDGTQALAPGVEEALYRVAQEALSNASRHSQASHVQIILELSGEEARLTISDNGKGFNSSREQSSRGVGLLSMEERMKELGGAVRITSAPGKGTLVEAHCARLGAVEKVIEANLDENDKQPNMVKVKKVENLRL